MLILFSTAALLSWRLMFAKKSVRRRLLTNSTTSSFVNAFPSTSTFSAENVEVEGKALTKDDVVEFVNNLRRTDFFANINLQESKAAVENKINIYQFKLAFRLKG